jgi:cytoskeleton protein RodZ
VSAVVGTAVIDGRYSKIRMESIGQTLREARHAKTASLEDAARATKIKIEILEKLESDEFDQLAAPMYTKGFLKLYSGYLGLDSQTIVDSYLRSQGGLRRQGLQVETEAAIRARKPPELKLPIRGVVRVVATLTAVVVLGLIVRHFRARHSHAQMQAGQPAQEQKSAPPTAAKAPATLPKADFDAYYQPKNKPAPELLDPSGK